MASVQDDFERADESPLGSPYTNGWGNGPLRLVGGGIAAPAATSYGVAIRGSSGLSVNQTVRVRIGVKNSFESVIAIARGSVASSGSGYLVEYRDQDDGVFLSRRTNGTDFAFNGGAAIGTRDIPVGEWLELRAENVGVDTRLRVFHYNGTTWTQIGSDITDVDASDIESGDPGFAIFNNNSNATRLSEWYAEDDLGASPTVSVPTSFAHGDVITAAITLAGSVSSDRTVTLRLGAVAITQAETFSSAAQAVFDAFFERAAPQTSIRRGVIATCRVTRTSDSTFGEDTFTTLSPLQQTYVDLTSINPTAAYRVTAVADLEVGDQLQFRGVGGGPLPAGFVPYPDATLGFVGGNPPVNVEVRVFDPDDNTLGEWALQTFSAQTNRGFFGGFRRHGRRVRGAGNWRN